MKNYRCYLRNFVTLNYAIEWSARNGFRAIISNQDSCYYAWNKESADTYRLYRYVPKSFEKPHDMLSLIEEYFWVQETTVTAKTNYVWGYVDKVMIFGISKNPKILDIFPEFCYAVKKG